MVSRNQVHKCSLCGNTVEVLIAGGGELSCCGSPMELFLENTVDAAKEKHVPVVERTAEGIRICVGSVTHPMDDSHYIQWIELLADGSVYRKHLKPGEPPVAEFALSTDDFAVREYCNLHGLWRADSV